MRCRWRFVLAWSFLLLALSSIAAPEASARDPSGDVLVRNSFLDVDDAFGFTVEQLPTGATRLKWQIAPDHYLYRERLSFAELPASEQPVLPRGEKHVDDYFGEMEIYRHSLEVTLPASAGGQITIGWQGCADAGLCYPPQHRSVDLDNHTVLASATDSFTDQPASVEAQDQSLARRLQEQQFGWSLLIFFGLGLLLAFTPCSLPMLPILASVVVGGGASPRRGLLLASSYTVSMALVYAALGVMAAFAGGGVQSWLQQPWLLGAFAVLFMALALSMFGLFELQLPLRVRDRLDRLGRGRQGGTVAGAGFLGALSGLLVGPCMTAPLAGVLLFIAQSGDLLKGGLALFALGMGTGLPLLVLVTAGNHLLPKPGVWMGRIKVAFGFLLLGTAIFLIRPLASETVWIALWGGLLIGIAIALRELSRQLELSRAVLAGSYLVSVIWGSAMLVGAAAGATNPWRPLAVYVTAGASAVASPAAEFLTFSQPDVMARELAAARADAQWVLIDYYADWCISCKIMEREVFGDAEVVAALEGVRLLRPDVTASSAASKALLERHDILGPPTLLWIGPEGIERRSARLVGEITADKFLKHWQTLRERG